MKMKSAREKRMKREKKEKKKKNNEGEQPRHSGTILHLQRTWTEAVRNKKGCPASLLPLNNVMFCQNKKEGRGEERKKNGQTFRSRPHTSRERRPPTSLKIFQEK